MISSEKVRGNSEPESGTDPEKVRHRMPKSETHPPRENPSVTRSRTLIAGAFLALLQERPYAQITITDLCARAGVSRRTFYRNFESLTGVLDRIADDLYQEFLRSDPGPGGTVPEHLLCLFTFVRRHSDLFVALYQNDLFIPLYRYYRRYSREVLLRLGQRSHSSTGEPERMPTAESDERIAFITGGLTAVLADWISRGCADSCEKMAARTTRILESF